MATNNGTNNGNNGSGGKREPTLEELLKMAMEEATAEPSKTPRKARPNGAQITPSAWFQGLATADQKVLAAAGWQEVPASFGPVAGSVTAAKPALAKPAQKPSKEGKVRGADAYDAASLAKLREEKRQAEEARYQLCCAVAATLARSKGRIAVTDLAALTVGFGLADKETHKTVVTMLAKRMNLPVKVSDGILTLERITMPTHACHANFAIVANKLIAKVRSDLQG